MHRSSFPGWREKLHFSDLEISVVFSYSSCLVSGSSKKTIGPERTMDENVKNMNTVVTRISGAALIKFFAPQMWRLFEVGD